MAKEPATEPEKQEEKKPEEQATLTTPKPTVSERQKEIIVKGLMSAKENGGIFLNPSGKTAPSLYPSGKTMSPFNSVVLAMHSDQNSYKTNSYTTFSETKKRGEAVQSKQKGVPYNWHSWNEYVHKEYPEDVISKEQYKSLPEDQQKQYKVIPKKETMILFNIDQTTFPMVHKEDYDKEVKRSGDTTMRPVDEKKDDMKLRMAVNQLILNVRDNLTPVRKDGTGVAYYDPKKDTIHVPAQNAYSSYPDYIGDVVRQMVTATGHPQRLGRIGTDMQNGRKITDNMETREMLIKELSAGAKSLQLGIPARLSPQSLENVDKMVQYLNEKPERMESIERDVDSAIGMINKAERGDKIELKPTSRDMENWQKDVPKEGVPEKFDAVLMLRDDDKHWTLYAKPENEPGFAVHPHPDDIAMFFNMLHKTDDDKKEAFRTGLGQKYYAEVKDNPSIKVDLFGSKATADQLSRVDKVTIFKTKATENDDSKILCVATIDGEKQKAKELTNDQWQRMWLAPDMKDYKKNLAGTLYVDVLAEQKQSQHTEYHKDEDKNDSKETKAETEKAEKQKDEAKKAEDAKKAEEAKKSEEAKQKTKPKKSELSPLLKQFLDLKSKHPDALLLFRTGDFYETYKQDAEKASKVLGITLTKSSKVKDDEGKPLAMAGFPYHALDAYLPKLIRAGHRIAICDQIEAPKQTISHDKEPEPLKQEQEETRSHGMHR